MRNFRIQIYNNGVSIDPSILSNMFQYYQKHGVTLNYDITQVNIPFDSSLVNSAMAGTVYVVQNIALPPTDHDISMFVYDLNQWKAPFWWPWPLWGNVPRDVTYMSNGKPVITIGYLQSDIVNVAQRFIHEPMHALAKIFGCEDIMDATTVEVDCTTQQPT